MKYLLGLLLSTQLCCGLPVAEERFCASSSVKKSVGRHLVVELSECTFPEMELDYEILLWYAAYRSGAEVLDVKTHTFSPQGWTGIALLGESHVSLHTWPEHKYVALDIFTCGAHVDVMAPIMFFITLFDAKRVDYQILDRGYYGPED